MGKYGDFLSQASEVRPKPANVHPQAGRRTPPSLLYGNIDAVSQVLSITKTVQFSANALSCWKDANRLTMHGLYTSQLRPGV